MSVRLHSSIASGVKCLQSSTCISAAKQPAKKSMVRGYANQAAVPDSVSTTPYFCSPILLADCCLLSMVHARGYRCATSSVFTLIQETDMICDACVHIKEGSNLPLGFRPSQPRKHNILVEMGGCQHSSLPHTVSLCVVSIAGRCYACSFILTPSDWSDSFTDNDGRLSTISLTATG